MAKQKKVNKTQLIEAGLFLIKNEGIQSFSARNIARVADCSTQPIYYMYHNLDELKEDVLRLAKQYLNQSVFSFKPTSKDFINACLGFIKFANDENYLFKALMLENQLGNYLSNKKIFNLLKQYVQEDTLEYELDERKILDILMRTWIFSNGIALLLASGRDEFVLNRYQRMVEETFNQNIK